MLKHEKRGKPLKRLLLKLEEFRLRNLLLDPHLLLLDPHLLLLDPHLLLLLLQSERRHL